VLHKRKINQNNAFLISLVFTICNADLHYFFEWASYSKISSLIYFFSSFTFITFLTLNSILFNKFIAIVYDFYQFIQSLSSINWFFFCSQTCINSYKYPFYSFKTVSYEYESETGNFLFFFKYMPLCIYNTINSHTCLYSQVSTRYVSVVNIECAHQDWENFNDGKHAFSSISSLCRIFVYVNFSHFTITPTHQRKECNNSYSHMLSILYIHDEPFPDHFWYFYF